MSRKIPIRAFLAITGNGTVYQTGVDLAKSLIIDTHTIGDPRSKTLHENVVPLHESIENLPGGRDL
jgi:hypothetical protein